LISYGTVDFALKTTGATLQNLCNEEESIFMFEELINDTVYYNNLL